MAVFQKSLRSFSTFGAASNFAKVEAQRAATLHTIRRADGGKFEVLAQCRHALDSFQKLAICCDVVRQSEDMGALRQACLKFGLSKAGWRFLNHHGEAAFKPAIQSSLDTQTKFINALSYIEWQCRAGLKAPLPQSMGERYVMTLGMILDLDFEIDPRIAYAGVKHWSGLMGNHQRTDFECREWVKILVWLKDEKPNFDRNQWRAGWAAIWRCYQNHEKTSSTRYQWISLLNEFSIDNWNIDPLNNSYMVALEGIRMRHCVATYTKRCFMDIYRLFSITEKSTNKSIATVGLSIEGGRWHLDELRRKCNKQPSHSLIKIGEIIASRYQESYVEDLLIRLKEYKDRGGQQQAGKRAKLMADTEKINPKIEPYFDSIDLNVLEKNAIIWEAYISGDLRCCTELQDRFVMVATGEIPPQSYQEQLWMRYQELLRSEPD